MSYGYYQPYWLDAEDELEHFGIKGMKWGIRRYQNADGTLTAAGKQRYGSVENLQADRKKRKETAIKVAKTTAKIAGITALSVATGVGIKTALTSTAGRAAIQQGSKFIGEFFSNKNKVKTQIDNINFFDNGGKTKVSEIINAIDDEDDRRKVSINTDKLINVPKVNKSDLTKSIKQLRSERDQLKIKIKNRDRVKRTIQQSNIMNKMINARNDEEREFIKFIYDSLDVL